MAIMEGPLSKWTNVMKGWQYRWFVLDDNAGLLSYYTSKEKMVRGTRRGCVRLKGAVIGIDDEDDSTFTITVDDKTFHFQARDTEERDKWIHSLEDTILRHTHSQTFQKKWEELHNSTSFEDFDKKLTEADAYLQVLIDQVKDLETRMEACINDSDKNQLVTIRDKTNDMLETVKHSIILLQIAKNATHPVNGVYQPFKGTLKTEALVKHSTPVKGTGNNKSEIDIPNKENIDCAMECDEGFLKSKPLKGNTGLLISSGEPENVPSKGSTTSSNRLNLMVPEISYSSSDDDDFFDATEDTISSIQSPNGQRIFEDAVETLGDEQKRRFSSQLPQNLVEIDYDALYEDEEEELGSMEGQGSVISHLLSQLKINMDLTKVVLPTFILERRSLLEMYADFFAHPDIFISIPDFDDPKDRMIQVVRWYLSAFHAGRKSSVAKKPYNPILGEIFKCFWAIPSIKESEKSAEKVRDGPVPWASKNNLTFIAEQVSHHPPVSAFYAEHVNKGISCSAHIWTKSKFLGLSIGVHNIGQGCINVLKHGEEYIITFPNGYGRSILTVPWIELGGDVSVHCSKTGYFANIKFHTKPFYSGKPHRITADVFHPNEKKPFLIVSGEWNGIMHAKWTTGGSEVFVDTKSIPIIKKRVKPLVEQEPHESRNLWKDVTTALRLRNVEAATESKFLLEQKQRAEAKDRLQNSTSWETRVFHQVEEQWIYDHSLHKRLQEEANEAKPV